MGLALCLQNRSESNIHIVFYYHSVLMNIDAAFAGQKKQTKGVKRTKPTQNDSVIQCHSFLKNER